MGNKNQTSTATTKLPSYLEQTYKALINAGTSAAQQPLQQYAGPRVAGFTPMQNQAFDLTQRAQGMGIPYLNAGSEALSRASRDVFPSLEKYNAENLQKYMDPYQQNVIDTTMANILKSNAVAQQGMKGTGMGMGVSPTLGDRMGLGQAELERNQAMTRNQTIAGLESSGFQNAQQQLAGQQSLQASTMGADQQRLLGVGAGFAGLGQQAQDQTYQGIAQLLQQGGQQQAQGQTQLDQAYQNFQQAQSYPKSQIEWLANLAYGSPKGSSTTTTTPGPSLLSQLAGLATAGASFIKSHGGGVAHLDTGGAIPPPMLEAPIAAPMLNQASYQVPAVDSWPGRNPPTTPGLNIGTSGYSYINALPQINPAAFPKRFSYAMPAGIMQSLSQLPHFSLKPKDLEANKKSRGGVADLGEHMDVGGITTPPRYVPDFSEALDPAPSVFSWHSSPTDPPPAPAPYAPAVAARTAPTSGFHPNMQLLMAGLGMMGASSPFPLQAIGQGAMSGLNAALDLDKNPVVDDSGPTVRVFYPSEHRWEDTGIPSTKYQELQYRRQMMQSGGDRPLTDPAERAKWGISPTDNRPAVLRMTDHGQEMQFPGAGGTTIQNYDPNAQTVQLSKTLDEKEAARLDAIQLQGEKAVTIRGDIDALRALGAAAPQGALPRILAERYPQFSTVGAAYSGIAQDLAANLHVAGIGSQSDREYAGALGRIGTLSNDPRGNQILQSLMARKADLDIQRAQAVTDFQNSGRTQAEAAKMRSTIGKLNQVSILSPEDRAFLATVPADARSAAAAPAAGLQGIADIFRQRIQGMTPDQVAQEKARVHASRDAAFGAAAVEQTLQQVAQ